MKYRVLVNHRFGEGWQAGDIVEMDEYAARVPLEEGALEVFLVADAPAQPAEVQDETAQDIDPLACAVCGFIAKTKAGAKSHARKHK